MVTAVIRATIPAAARRIRSIACFLFLLVALLPGASGCDVDSDDGDGSPPDAGFDVDGASADGPGVWIAGQAVREEGEFPFLVMRTRTGWELTWLDLPYASAAVYALAARGMDAPWLACEGLTDADAGDYETALYRVRSDGLVEVEPPRRDLAVTAIAPQDDGGAWIVAAVRLPGTLAGYAGYYDGASWRDDTPTVDSGIERWNLSNADFPTTDEGAVLGLVSGDVTGQGIVGALFLYGDGVWSNPAVPFDPLADVYIFTDVRYTPEDVLVVGRVNLTGWIAHYDPAGGTWSAEDLSAFDRSAMWEMNSVVEDGAGTRYAFGAEDVEGTYRPLILADDGTGWREMESTDGALDEPRQVQPSRAAFLAPEAGFAIVREYYFGDGDSRQRDSLFVLEEGAWVDESLAIPEERYEFCEVAAIRTGSADR